MCFVGDRERVSVVAISFKTRSALRCSAGGEGVFRVSGGRERGCFAHDTRALCLERKFCFWHWLTHCDFPEPEKVKSRFRWPVLYVPFVSRRAPVLARSDPRTSCPRIRCRCAENQSGKLWPPTIAIFYSVIGWWWCVHFRSFARSFARSFLPACLPVVPDSPRLDCDDRRLHDALRLVVVAAGGGYGEQHPGDRRGTEIAGAQTAAIERKKRQ